MQLCDKVVWVTLAGLIHGRLLSLYDEISHVMKLPIHSSVSSTQRSASPSNSAARLLEKRLVCSSRRDEGGFEHVVAGEFETRRCELFGGKHGRDP